MALQHLRSNTANKRPTAGAMSDGQIAVNTNATSPGLFFKDAGGAIIKVGPVHVGTTAPNSSPAGSTGNSLGEQWLDTSGGGYVLKIWDGSAWRSEAGEFVNATGDTMTGALILPSGTAAAPALGVGSTDNGIYSPGADQVALSTNGTGRLFINAAGTIQTEATGQIETVSSAGTLTLYGGSTNKGGGIRLAGGNTDADIRFYAQTFTATPSERLRITSTGQLSFIGAGTSGSPAVGFNGSAPSNSLVVDSLGKVGIGTSSPGTKTHIYDASDVGLKVESGGANYTEFNLTNTSASYTIGIRPDVSNALVIRDANATANRVAIDTSGRVGIGTTSPDRKLHVNTDNAAAAKFGGTGAGDFAIEIGQLNAGGSPGFNATGGSSMLFDMGGSEAMRIDSSGRLLVGTSSSPSASDTSIKANGAVLQNSYTSSFNISAGGSSTVDITTLVEAGYTYQVFAKVNNGSGGVDGHLVALVTVIGSSSIEGYLQLAIGSGSGRSVVHSGSGVFTFASSSFNSRCGILVTCIGANFGT